MKKTIAVIGAGPKAAAIACKAAALRTDPRYAEDCPEVVVFESRGVGANWTGAYDIRQAEYTDGSGLLVTPPEKDVGFPYSTVFGETVNQAMLPYSWLAHKATGYLGGGLLRYAGWIDSGRPQPTLAEWGEYVVWALGQAIRAGGATLKCECEVKSISILPGNRVKLTWDDAESGAGSGEFDGVVVTGPGPAKQLDGRAQISQALRREIPDARTYWTRVQDISKKANDAGEYRIAVIGRGEAAAAIIDSILRNLEPKDTRVPKLAPAKTVTIINSAGILYTRGTSRYETQFFSNPSGWGPEEGANPAPGLHETTRRDIIRRADRGVFSPSLIQSISLDHRVRHLAGVVRSIKNISVQGRRQLEISIDSGGGRAGGLVTTRVEQFDFVISALGFDHGALLGQLGIKPKTKAVTGGVPDWSAEEESIDEHLRLDTNSHGASIHVPMLAGVRRGPGFPTLACLGVLADRILSAYVEPIEPPSPRAGPSGI